MLITSVPHNYYSQLVFPVRPSFAAMKKIILSACGAWASCTPSRVRVRINKLEIIYISVQNKSELSYPNPSSCSRIWSVSTLCFIFKAPHGHELFTKATSHSPKGLRIASRVRDGVEGGRLVHKNAATHVSLSCHEYCCLYKPCSPSVGAVFVTRSSSKWQSPHSEANDPLFVFKSFGFLLAYQVPIQADFFNRRVLLESFAEVLHPSGCNLILDKP